PVGRSWRGGGLRRGPSACWLPPHVRAGDLLHSFADLSDRDDALQRCPRPPEPPRAVFSGRDIDEFGDFDKPPPAASHLYARVRQVPARLVDDCHEAFGGQRLCERISLDVRLPPARPSPPGHCPGRLSELASRSRSPTAPTTSP